MVKPCLIVKVVKDQMYCSNKTNQLKKFKAQKRNHTMTHLKLMRQIRSSYFSSASYQSTEASSDRKIKAAYNAN